MKIINEILNIKKNLDIKFKEAKNYHELLVIKNSLIGKKSNLNKIFSNLSSNEKKEYGSKLKEIKELIQIKFDEFTKKLNFSENLDIKEIKIFEKFKKINGILCTRVLDEKPIINNNLGIAHPLNLIINKIHIFFDKFNSIFIESNDIEEVKYNFDFLNIKKDHPSRAKSDTFYLNEKLLLRTHCTNFTARTLMNFDESIDKTSFFYTIGNVYRNDEDDQTHTHQFLQLDVCFISKEASIATLKWILKKFTEFLFGKDKEVRFRTNAFPFTVPSLELDVECWFCKKINECSICKNTGWIEILGGGIIAPEVLKNCNKNKNLKVIAFGVGIERMAMLKYGISDIRDFYKNKLERKQ